MIVGTPREKDDKNGAVKQGIAGICWRSKRKVQPPHSFKFHVNIYYHAGE
jgi:hypothetical protein